MSFSERELRLDIMILDLMITKIVSDGLGWVPARASRDMKEHIEIRADS